MLDLEPYFDTAFAAPDGIKKLRELILTLAMQGKLVEQDPNDPPTRALLKEIEAEKQRLVTEGKIKAPKALPAITPEEVPYALPEGWEWVRLVESYYSVGGKSNQLQTKDYCIEGQYPIIDQGKKYIAAYTNDANKLLYIDKPIVVFGDHTKNIKYIDFNFVIGADGVKTLCPYSGVDTKFLFYLMHSYDLTDRGYARHFKVLNEQLLPLPPLPEQQRIVARIDQLMARCDALEALRTEQSQSRLTLQTAALRPLLNATDAAQFAEAWQFVVAHFAELYGVRANVQELHKAILQLAVMGKLVPQDPTDPPASELLKEIEAEKQRLVKEKRIKAQKPLPAITAEEMPFALPEGWEWVRVWDIAQTITSGSRDWAKYYSDSGAIFVTMSNLSRGSYKLRLDTMRYVNPPEDKEGARTKLETNDLLISITGDVGNLGLIPPNFGEAYINQHTCLLRFMPHCQNRFFPELLLSPLAKEQFDAPQRGIKNSFRLGDVGEMLIPIPPLPEQHRIVAKIDQLMALCDELEQSLEAQTDKQGALLNAVMSEI